MGRSLLRAIPVRLERCESLKAGGFKEYSHRGVEAIEGIVTCCQAHQEWKGSGFRAHISRLYTKSAADGARTSGGWGSPRATRITPGRSTPPTDGVTQLVRMDNLALNGGFENRVYRR